MCSSRKRKKRASKPTSPDSNNAGNKTQRRKPNMRFSTGAMIFFLSPNGWWKATRTRIVRWVRENLQVLKSFGIARIPGASLLAALAFAGWAVSSPSPRSGAQNDAEHDMVLQSLEFYRHGDCKKAEPLFEQILLRQPKDIATRKLLGNCYLQDKKMDEARTQFQ